jgi:hypothetical protein
MLARKLVDLAFGYQFPPADYEPVQVKYFIALVKQQREKDDTGGHKGEERRQRLSAHSVHRKSETAQNEPELESARRIR